MPRHAARPEPDPETPDGRDLDSGADPWDPPWLVHEDDWPRDDLGSASLPWARLPYPAAGSEAERAAARRFLDDLADQ